MNFQLKERDLLARIGKLETKSSTIETPSLLPVVNPALQMIPPSRMGRQFGFKALITNAYILKKCFKEEPARIGVHTFLGFEGAIMTDSGAYQILVYGDIETTPDEIVEYQERINTDIATILDWPTGWRTSRKNAEKTVKETLERARRLFKIKTREDILWVGPIQGGRYLDLMAGSAREMGRLPFQIYALGSPTEVMESYRFDVLTDMIMTAKMNLPMDKPFHLFGAGHPFMFSLAAALGCDLFDSAAYAIYAREKRYMTETGTARLEELEHFPCPCPKCTAKSPKEVMEMPRKERETFLAEHNLYICLSEIKRIKLAIREGRLWEHLELRAHGHPALLQALKKLKKYEEFIEKHSPSIKRSGLFFFSHVGLARPEVVRHKNRLFERCSSLRKAETLILMPQTRNKPFHKSKEFKILAAALKSVFDKSSHSIRVCFYEAPFGVVPLEVDEVYPLSQHETALPTDGETVKYVAAQVENYIKRGEYKNVVLIKDSENWGDEILKACEEACKAKSAFFKFFDIKGEWIGELTNFWKKPKKVEPA